MTIRYISAGDRINYGDFLFSLVFNEYFKDSFSIEYYGVVESDFSSFGALRTKSFKSLIKDVNPAKDVVVVGGGEVFFGNWTGLYAYINTTYANLLRNGYFKRLERKLKIAKHLLGNRNNEFPFVPNLKVENIFIGGGGQFIDNMAIADLAYLKKSLAETKFLSVRDLRTQASFTSQNIKSDLIPDSAVLMSKVYTLDVLEEKVSDVNRLRVDGKYIFLQLALAKGPKDLNKFGQDVKKLSSEMGYKVICCPIGIAPGHEDDVILKQLCAMHTDWQYVHPQNLFDIMFLIAKSDLYIGTSLHGAITAFSFNKPIIGLNKRIQKINSFVETWCEDFYEKAIDFNDVYTNYKSILAKWNAEAAQKKMFECQSIVEDYFTAIQKHLKAKA